MELINEKIEKLIGLARSNSEFDFTPISLDFDEYISSDSMKDIVISIKDNEGQIFNSSRSILENERLRDILRTFKFHLKVCKSNNVTLEKCNELLFKSHGFTISEEELKNPLLEPEEVIMKKVNYKSDDEIDVLLKARIESFNITQSSNEVYKISPKCFVLATILLEHFIKRYYNPIDFASNNYDYLIRYFKDKGVDINNQNQFSKYNIFQLNEDCSSTLVFPPRLFFKSANATVFLNGIEDFTFRYLIELYNSMKFELSFKPSSLFFLEGVYTIEKVEEHLETGKYFNFSNFKNSLLTKLYNENYDTLWVKIDGLNITFEEIFQDYEVYNESIVTQVIHCEYVLEKDFLFITHLDHEYIFYSIEEFEKRQANPEQKGEARKRIKTFKIDNAKIPVTDEKNVLFDFLTFKFKNRELLSEYFAKISV